ncbi:DUF4154 domain-containing protein [Xylophilus sp. Kf1]|nr:DUF4154 domain-containing protein [Xylophilus sp. Kf1]
MTQTGDFTGSVRRAGKGHRISKQRVIVVSVLGCAAALLGHAAPAPVAVSGPADSRTAQDAALTVHGILGFARWPGDPHRIRLCVVGRTRFGDALPPGDRKHRHQVTVHHGLPADAGACEALYLGNLPPRQWDALQRRIADRPVLTIGDGPEVCRRGGMFCLAAPVRGAAGFEVNLDSLARSRVHVHPGVLEMALHRHRPP